MYRLTVKELNNLEIEEVKYIDFSEFDIFKGLGKSLTLVCKIDGVLEFKFENIRMKVKISYIFIPLFTPGVVIFYGRSNYMRRKRDSLIMITNILIRRHLLDVLDEKEEISTDKIREILWKWFCSF